MLAHGNGMSNDHKDDHEGGKSHPCILGHDSFYPLRPGFQPLNIMIVRDLECCPRLVWDGPLARKIKSGISYSVPNLIPFRSRTVSVHLPSEQPGDGSLECGFEDCGFGVGQRNAYFA